VTDPLNDETTVIPATAADAEIAPAGEGAAAPPSPVEPGAASPAVPPPAGPVSRPTGASGGRWLLAFGVAGLVLVVTAIGVILLGSRSTPEALRYIPADMPIVAELRVDLPGDQLQKVGNLLAHFPGFKDQSSLTSKLDEAFARITTQVSTGSASYATDVKPWLAGPLFVGARMPSSAGSTTAGIPTPSAVAVFTTDGKVTCDPITKRSTAKEAYKGIDIHGGDGGAFACALDGRYALVGDSASIKAAIDAHANHSGVDGDSQYRKARDALGGDRLATVYFSVDALKAGAFPSAIPGLPTAGMDVTTALATLPPWVMAGISAEDSAIVADVVSGPIGTPAGPNGSPLLTMPAAHASRLALLVPADTAVLYELHGTGALAQNLLTTLRANPTLSGPLGQLDATLGVLGGPQQLIGWIDDAGIVLVQDGSSLTGGVLVQAPDDATAAAKADQVRSLLTLAGLTSGITTRDIDVNGTKVTIADLGDISALLSQAGAAVGGLTVPPGTHIVISVASHGSTLIIGSGESFARRILGTAAGSSLADEATYKTALGRSIASNSGQLYIAAAPLLAFADTNIPAQSRAQFDTDVKPYIAPFDAFLETTSSDPTGVRIRFVISVK
jgi:Protein of unknown function (DUF3352)